MRTVGRSDCAIEMLAVAPAVGPREVCGLWVLEAVQTTCAGLVAWVGDVLAGKVSDFYIAYLVFVFIKDSCCVGQCECEG